MLMLKRQKHNCNPIIKMAVSTLNPVVCFPFAILLYFIIDFPLLPFYVTQDPVTCFIYLTTHHVTNSFK